MKFKTWVEQEATMGTPEMMPPQPINKGNETPASDEVKRTGLQPQVDAPNSKADKEKDSVSAVDSEISHMDNSLPDGSEDTPKINKFKQLWDQLKQSWEMIKTGEEEQEPDEEDGLGHAKDDRFTQTMRQFPNMMPMSPETQGQNGPGTFGLS